MREIFPAVLGFESHPRTNTPSSGAVHISPLFKSSSTEFNVNADIHDYVGRLRRARERLSRLENSSILLSFIDHLSALGLSVGRVAKYANQLCTLMKNCPFEDLKILVRKLVQYAKCGSCGRNTPVPPAEPGQTSGNTLIIPLGVPNIVLDGSGNNNHGTIYGATWTDGKYGKALSFDGTSCVEVLHSAVFDLNQLSIAFWIKTPTSMGQTWRHILGQNHMLY